jgi:hypothetical protein
MQFSIKATVLGAKMFKDQIDGKQFDITKIFVQQDLDSSRGTAKGFAVTEYSWGTSDNFKAIQHNPFPFEAELTVEMVTTGKNQKINVLHCKPIAVSSAKASA